MNNNLANKNDFLDLTMDNTHFREQIKDISVEEMFGGKQFKINFKNGISTSSISHMYSYGGRDGLWEIMISTPNPFTTDVFGYLQPEELVDWLNQCSKLPMNKEKYSFSKKEINYLNKMFENKGITNVEDSEESTIEEKLLNELANKLVNNGLISMNMVDAFEYKNFGNVGFQENNKEKIIDTINAFAIKNNLLADKDNTLPKPKQT